MNINTHRLELDQTGAGNRPMLEDHERTPCEVWTRVMGYHRPVNAFNPGKQAEHADRTYFREHRQ